MFCKYCGKESGGSDVCSECSEKINSFMQESNKTVVSKNQGYDWYSAQMGGEEDKNKDIPDPYMPKPKFLSFPRVMAFIGLILYVICLIMPVYHVMLMDMGVENDEALLDISSYFIVIPIVMLFNIIFDRGKWVGLHFRVFRFKLLILFSVINIITLIFAPALFVNMGYHAYLINFTPFFYVAVVASIITIIAPLFAGDGSETGVKPVKKVDLLWIVPTFALLGIIILGVHNLDSRGEYMNMGPEKYYALNAKNNMSGISTADSSAADIAVPEEQVAVNENTAPAQPQVSQLEKDKAAYREKIKAIADKIYLNHCVYDVDKDGIDDIIFRNPMDDETLYYAESDVECIINKYDVYIYRNGDFINAGQVASINEVLYKSNYNGIYGYFDNIVKSAVLYDEELDFPVEVNFGDVFIKFKLEGTEMAEDNANSIFELEYMGEYAYLAGEEEISSSDFDATRATILGNEMQFVNYGDYSQVNKAAYDPK